MKTVVLILGVMILTTHLSLSSACKCDSSKHQEVCGQDGETYQNSCYLFCKNLGLKQKNLPTIEIRCNSNCAACDYIKV